MDDHTLAKLEFPRIAELLAEQAQCGLGRDLAHRIRPSSRATQIESWLEQARQFTAYVAGNGLPPFGGIHDVRPLVRKAVPPAKLEPEEFGDLASTLMGLDAVRRYFVPLTEQYALVRRVVERIGDFRVIADRINNVIDSRGKVRDSASERLGRIRHQIDGASDEIRQVFDRILHNPSVLKYLQYANSTFHDDRTVLPVKSDQRGRVPGIVHRSSDSGQTLFVEPAEAVELNNKRINLLAEEKDEINRILWELTHLVHLNQTELLRTLEAIAVIDLLSAKVRFAQKFGMNLPTINPDHRMFLREARNPVLLALAADSPDHRVVPIDVRLGEDFDIMVLTGPNTGGKTATLKTIGLLTLMAHAGLPIPAAAGSTLPVFDGVWIDVGDEQSLEQSLSTFSAHLARILNILQRARRSTLVLLDELGAGTDPDEGTAIGRAIVNHLLQSGCLAVVTTHLGGLKALAYETKRVDNASVQFDLQTLRPTYVLCIGEPGNSNAIDIAARLGMPRRLVQAARKELDSRYRALHRAIAGTLHSRREAERARRDAELARADAARATLAAMDKAKALEAEHKSFAAHVERILKLQAGDTVFVRRFDKSGRIVRVRFEKQQASVDLGSMEVEIPFNELVFDRS